MWFSHHPCSSCALQDKSKDMKTFQFCARAQVCKAAASWLREPSAWNFLCRRFSALVTTFRSFVGGFIHVERSYIKFARRSVSEANKLKPWEMNPCSWTNFFLAVCVSNSQTLSVERLNLLNYLTSSSSLEPLMRWILEYTQVDYAFYNAPEERCILYRCSLRKASATCDVSNLDFETWIASPCACLRFMIWCKMNHSKNSFHQ